MPVTWKSNIKLKTFWSDRVHAALVAVCERHGLKMQDHARDNAIWTDRTGHARQGLFYQVEGGDKSVKIHLAHTMEYGLWLEVANGGKYAIIMPTIDALLGQLKQDLEAIFA